jgi:hypothetical protein
MLKPPKRAGKKRRKGLISVWESDRLQRGGSADAEPRPGTL